MIRFEDVTKNFGEKPAVAKLSLEIKAGEKMILLGTSGCGKTTTLRMANRLIEPSSGTIFINDQDILQQQPEQLRRGIGYVLQHNSLFPHYTVAENIAIVPGLLKWNASKIEERITTLLKQLKLPENCRNQLPSQLSGGQQQRVNVARALAADPPILLMDEPFGALDPLTRASVRKEFLQLEAIKQKTVLMVTHDVEEAFEIGDRICLMHEGKIVQVGVPSDLLFKPREQFVKDFLSGQMLSLALKTTTIQQIVSYLPEPVKYERNDACLSTSESINTALELITNNHSQNGIISIGDASENHWQVNGAALWMAFHKYQQKNQ